MTFPRSLVIVTLAFTPVADVPTAPQPREVQFYFPTTVGSRWAYQHEDVTKTEVITAVEEKDGVKLVSVAREEGGKRIPAEKLLVSARGVTRVGAGGNDLGYELHMLSLPVKPGQQWEFGATTVTVVGIERVEVPAGKFMAVRVDKVVPLRPSVTFAYWYAPDVGVVQRSTKVGDGGKERVEVLKSFTLGKE